MSIERLSRELALREAGGGVAPADPGSGHSVTDLILHLASRVEKLDLITLDPRLTQIHQYCGGNVRLAAAPYRSRIRTMAKDLFRSERSFIEGSLRSWKPDVVGAHWTYEFALAAIDSDIPHLITVRDWAPSVLYSMRDAYRTVRLYMQFMTFLRGSNFAAVSPYMARKVESVTRKPVPVIPNGIERRWLDGPQSEVSSLEVVAANHGFSRHKNVQSLLLAWPAILRRVPGARLNLVGRDFELGGPAQTWAHERSLAERVEFHGPLERLEIRDLLESASVFAHASLGESFGMTVLEAMAIGVPVVGGNDSGAIPWLLTNGAGVLVNVREPTALAAGVSRLLLDTTLRAEMAKHGRARAREFNIEGVASDYLEHLADLSGAM